MSGELLREGADRNRLDQLDASREAIPRHQKHFSTREEHRMNKNNNALIARRDQSIMALIREPLVERVAMRRELGEPQARVGNDYD